MNTLITFFVRSLEFLFVIGGIGCICSVIPITAYRLFMVLFEPENPAEEAYFSVQAQRSQTSPALPQTSKSNVMQPMPMPLTSGKSLSEPTLLIK